MTRPDLSVVVPAVNTLSDVLDCLAHLDRQRTDVNLEVLLIDRLGGDFDKSVRAEHPWVRVLPAEKRHTIPEMRAIAFDSARGRAVAVIEDHVMVPEGWARRMLSALKKSDGVVGGSVENAATRTLLDWACFLCEYSNLIPPIEAGDVPSLTGNNVVYEKGLLDRFRDAYRAGKWENYLHDQFKLEGVRLICRPEIEVGHKKHYTFGEYLSQRYLYARSYAGARVAGKTLLKRLIYGLAAFILPPLLFVRIFTGIWRKGRHRGLLVRSAPLIAFFVISWGLGEVVGYWFGDGGALAKVC